MITPTNYTSYRAFLADYLTQMRATSRVFTVRRFCQKAGISTNNYLLRILRGQRNLGPKLIDRFIKVVGLRNDEAKYFRAMVALESQTNFEEQANVQKQMDLIRRKLNRPPLVTDNSLLRHWYLLAIWELASCKGFVLTPKSAVKALGHRISVQEAKEAIEFLFDRGYVIEKDGRLIQAEKQIASTDEIPNALVNFNHKETLKQAIEALNLPVGERGFYSLTLAIDQRRLPELKERIKKFQAELHAEFCLDEGADRVYLITGNCFPVAKAE